MLGSLLPTRGAEVAVETDSGHRPLATASQQRVPRPLGWRRSLREQCVELVEPRLRRVVVHKSAGTLHLADDGIERAVGVLWRTEIAPAGVRLAGKAFQSAAVSRDLPMPASPERSTTWPSPFFALAQRRSSSSDFSSRPTRAVRPLACSASKQLSTELARSAAQMCTDPAMPLNSFAPRSLSE